MEGYWLTADRQLVSSFRGGLSACCSLSMSPRGGREAWLLHVLPHTTSPHLTFRQRNQIPQESTVIKRFEEFRTTYVP